MKISLADYYMGRRDKFGDELTAEMMINAEETVKRINALVDQLIAHGIELHRSPETGTIIVSGWRPRAINAATPRAAINSKHMTCRACDIYDPDSDIDELLYEYPEILEVCGLWMEHPSATKGYCHVQIVPPNSKRRIFYP